MHSIFILGGTGFVGRHLINDFLENDITFVQLPKSIVDQPQLVEKYLEVNGRKTLVYLGWSSNSQPNYRHSVENYKWLNRTKNIIDFVKSYDIKLVIPGSCAEYMVDDKSPYVQSKRMLLDYLKSTEIDYLWPRIFYAFSKEDLRPGIMKEAHLQVLGNSRIKIAHSADAQDYIEIRDVARQINMAIKQEFTGELDVGSGKLHLTSELLKCAFPDLQIDFGRKPIGVQNIYKAKVDSNLFKYEGSFTFQYFGA
jgi:nucleoside-diphosphate-sugar epimerase